MALLVFGVDSHKATHTVAAADALTGRALGDRTFQTDEPGMRALLRWAHSLGSEKVFALEDCRALTARLERTLMAAGECVVRVRPAATARARKHGHSAGKSDAIDARAVLRAALSEGLDRLPAAWLNPTTVEIRVLADHRANLVAERSRLISRLRWHLLDLAPALEARLTAQGLNSDRGIARVVDGLASLPASARLRVTLELLSRISELNVREGELAAELRQLTARACPELLKLPGCGVISAATIISHVGDARRFPTDGHLARFAGVAPITDSSGAHDRLRVHRGGDRQLNAALYRIAHSQSQHHPEAKTFIARKRSEGKTQRHALRCLQRHTARRIWQILRHAAAAPAQADTTRPRATGAAPPASRTRRAHASARARLATPVRRTNNPDPEASRLAADANAIPDRVRTRLQELQPAVAEYRELQRFATRWGTPPRSPHRSRLPIG
jgi:transposase